jgi:hypothetical protein
MSYQSFEVFLKSECISITALVNELGTVSLEDEEVNMKMMDQISRYSKLQSYYDGLEMNTGDAATENVSTNLSMTLYPWPRSVRVMVIDHLITMEINISLLTDIVESYRFDLAKEELVEIVRSLDILGAERRLSEYEALLFIQSKRKGTKIYEKRLPVSYFDHTKKFELMESSAEVLGMIGSQRLIEYFLEYNKKLNKEHILLELCCSGHLSVAQWLFSLGNIDVYFSDECIFRDTCFEGHFLVIQWLYSLGNFDIHLFDESAFRGACRNGHLEVAQWLYNLDNVIDIHAEGDAAFRGACNNGQLLVAQWLYQLGGFDIQRWVDNAFRNACHFGHLPIAQWLYDLGGVDIHASNDIAFQVACANDHFAVAQWLYHLGGINIHVDRDAAFNRACSKGHLSIAQWLYSFGEISMHCREEVFKSVCSMGHLSVAQWLYEIGEMSIGFIETVLNSPIQSEIRVWLYQLHRARILSLNVSL